MSEEKSMTVFSLAGPQAATSLTLVGCASVPPPGRSVEVEYDGEKV